ncbi:hypothetical protein N6L27_03495 [Leisingera sp. SS27]|uniref:hypothetical protein n=1 Tax=Leisingera sp. SS27 TaxID=2979462 RepID=UPI00232D6249|nr:hypothetical protein [Leisingera sp. SS27]MDC0657055.1 hypothetical protein [Leisingera sp. SS27]
MTDDLQNAPEAEDLDAVAPENLDAVGEQEQPAPPAPQWSDEDAEEARLFGWKSPDEWQGDKPAGYIDNPEEFLDRVKRSRIFSTMSEKLETQEREARETARRMEAMNTAALERQKAQFDADMDRITKQQRQAAADADPDRFDELENQRQALMKQQPQEPVQTPQVDPFVENYRASEQGAWLNNPVLFNTGRELINARPDIMLQPPQKQVEFAEAELRKMYPAYFPQPDNPKPKPKPRQAVDPGGLGGGGAVASGAFTKLPADAKAQFKRFVEQGVFKNTKEDQEEFANDFNAA